MSFPKYPDYKPSRLDTKAPLPASWSEAPIKRAFDIVSGSTPKTDNEEFWDGETIWVTPADLSGLGAVDVTESKRTITEAGLLSCGTTLVPAGSIVISTRAPIGTLAIAGKELCTNQGCKALVPNGECLSRFAYYYLSACTEQLNIKGRGTTFLELSGDELGGFLMPKPAPVEQELICTFLDRETAKIDALITEQQRLIELLQEKRQAVISHAVTKGLNPNAPMKDSGVEWLGEVPEHWGVAPLKQLIKRGSSISYGIVQPGEPLEDGIPFVQTTNMSQGDFTLDALQKTTSEIASNYPRSTLTGGEVLLGIRASIGAAHIAPDWLEGANLSRGVARISTGPLILNRFLVFYLRSEATTKYWILGKQGSTFNEVSIDTVKNLKVCVPPISEQDSIACYAQETSSQYDESLSQSRDLIALLQERRSALISAAVTGQIDVRGLATEEAA